MVAKDNRGEVHTGRAEVVFARSSARTWKIAMVESVRSFCKSPGPARLPAMSTVNAAAHHSEVMMRLAEARRAIGQKDRMARLKLIGAHVFLYAPQ